MRQVRAMALAAAVFAAPAAAAGYDDFTLGMTANLRGDYDAAVKAFTAALAAPDLVAAYKPAAYRGRAQANLQIDKCSEALADIRAFDGLRPGDASVTFYRIWAELCLKDAVAARRDLDAVAKGKIDAGDLFEFARMEWRFDLFDDAMTTAADAYKAVDKEAYSAAYILLWQALAAHRAGKFEAAPIAAGLAELKLDDWPKPLLELYLGKQTPDGVRKEATSWRQSKEDAQTCEANFYTAEWHLGRGDKVAATPLLLAVARSCPADFLELPAARSELKRLGVPIPKE